MPAGDNTSPTAPPKRLRTLSPRAILILFVFLAVTALVATPGSGHPLAAALAVISLLLSAGSLAVLWTFGALGLGRAFSPVIKPITHTPTRLALQLSLGVATALTLAHLLGLFGLLNPWVAWAPTLLGLALLVAQVRDATRRASDFPLASPAASPLAFLALLPLALLTVAASNPPGTLWRSEARAYDVLSYHLMLPREWIELGRITPLTHNVYSFLPSYVESAYAQLALMFSAGSNRPPLGLGDGAPVHAAAFLHAALAVATALALAALTHRLLRQANSRQPAHRDDALSDRAAATTAFLLFLSIPWTIVTASLAYNEMAVTLCFAGALLAATETTLRPTLRAALAAFLVGVACSAKPTALFLVAPPVAIALAFTIPPRRWFPAALATIPAGLAPLLPWLARNALAADGNPVFPALTSLLSPAHWSPDQIARWNDAHHVALSLPARLARLLHPDYGLTHPQYSILFPLTALAAVIAVTHRPTRRIALLALAMLASQFIAWLFFGHLQSRFLITATIPATLLFALATSAILRARRPSRPIRLAAPVLAVAALIASSFWIFLRENDGAPNFALVPGVAALNNAKVFRSLPPLDRAPTDFYSNELPSLAANNLDRISDTPSPTVLLVGDATPLYLGAPPTRIIYATTWDSHPLAEALRSNDNDPLRALDMLRRQGVTHLLVNLAELNRLQTSGYLDPILDPSALLFTIARHTNILVNYQLQPVFLVAIPR